MINGITSYTPNRQVQKVNFGELKVTRFVKKQCGLSDDDITKLNDRCPKGFNFLVHEGIGSENHSFNGENIEVGIYKSNGKAPKKNEFFDIYGQSREDFEYFPITRFSEYFPAEKVRPINNKNFWDVINKVLGKYNKQ
jgi:hypothetical protein